MYRDWGDTFLFLAITLIAGSVAIGISFGALVMLTLVFSTNVVFILPFLLLTGLSVLLWYTTVGAFGDMLDS